MSPSKNDTILFIGAGAMGSAMIGQLTQAGYRVLINDVDRKRSAAVARESGGEEIVALDARSLGDVSTLILMVPNSAVVATVLSDGLLAALPAGTLIIDMSSSNPPDTVRVAEGIGRAGHEMIDAPVSGGVARARTGELAIMCGGDESILSRARPVLDVLGATVTHVGPIGAGHALKALNNLLSAIGIVGAAEVFAIGRKWGLDAKVMLDVINASTGRNQATEVKFEKFVLSRSFDSGFSLGLMVKDIQTALGLAADGHASVPIATATMQAWIGAQEMLGEADHTEIARYVDRNAGAEAE